MVRGAATDTSAIMKGLGMRIVVVCLIDLIMIFVLIVVILFFHLLLVVLNRIIRVLLITILLLVIPRWYGLRRCRFPHIWLLAFLCRVRVIR